MIRLAFPCCKYEVNPYANLLKSSINLVLKQDVSPLSVKKLMLYTNGDKQLLGNYLPISLLPISGKVLGRLLYNSMFEVFMENILISPNQSGFKTGDSMLSATHKIYISFYDGCEVREVFLHNCIQIFAIN